MVGYGRGVEFIFWNFNIFLRMRNRFFCCASLGWGSRGFEESINVIGLYYGVAL